MTGLLQSLGQLTCIKMCPPLTTKNLATYRPLLALGTVTGHIQLVNVSTGLVEREIAVHSGPVQVRNPKLFSSTFYWVSDFRDLSGRVVTLLCLCSAGHMLV